MERVYIFDTTLRDGEQSPGASMNVSEKLTLAKQLERLGVDIIEAGFAISSPGEFEAIVAISNEIKGPIICSLARAKEKDIEASYNALKDASKKRIHIFHSSSDIHLKYQYRITKEEALKRSFEMVKFAKSLVDDVEFSPMDATRTDIGFLCEMIDAAISAGASTINIPDTVGYSVPEEFGKMIKVIKERIKDNAIISVHCHNDLGLAVSNALQAVLNGARQIECTINGIGERAGNCSLEEVVMALKTRSDIFNCTTGINTTEIIKTSRLVTKITGISVQPNKAIVGANAFSHEAGIHQDGLLKEKLTYEIIKPESVGLHQTELILGKHSGRHAFKVRLKEMGYNLDDETFNKVFTSFKVLADQKKEIFEEDIRTLVEGEAIKTKETYTLEEIFVISGTKQKPQATIKIKEKDKIIEKTASGDGPIDAAYKAIGEITKTKASLLKFEVKAITGGTDALGEVMVSIKEGGRIVRGYGADCDIIVASCKAYISAINKLAVN